MISDPSHHTPQTAKAPAKVLFVLPNFAGGGAERVALTLLARLDRDRFDPQLAVLDNQGALRPLLAPWRGIARVHRAAYLVADP